MVDGEQAAARYATSRDPAVKAEVVSAFQWLTVTSARRMRRGTEPVEDLIQVCNVGLLEALERYDPTMGTFRRFASATIDGELRHHYRSGWRLRVPRSVQELYLRVRSAVEVLTGELHRSPTMWEISQHTGASIDEVLEAVDAGSNFRPVSLTLTDWERADGLSCVDDVESVDRRVDVRAAVAGLPGLEGRVLALRFFEGRSRGEVASVLGVPVWRVSSVERAGLCRLRAWETPDVAGG